MPYKRKTPIRSPQTEALWCVLYARVSTKEQQEEGYSIDSQLALLRGYAERHGLKVANVYIEAASGSKLGRKEFARMLAYIHEHPGTIVVAEKLDRICRNFHDIVKFEGVDLRFAKDGQSINSQSKASEKLLFGVQVVLAKHFSDNLREETMKGMVEKAKQGVFPSFAPIGYLNAVDGSRKTIVPDPDRAVLVRRIFEAYAAGGHSLATLTAHAREIGLRTRKGHVFVRSSIGRILENPLYAGLIVWGDVRAAGSHEAIVSHKLFEAVQARLHGRGGAYAGSTVELTYRGLMDCGHCGKMVTGHVKKGIYEYYHCRTVGCPGRKLTAGREVTAQYAELLDGMRLTRETLELIRQSLREYTAVERTAVEEQLAVINRQQRKLRGQLEQIYLDRLAGDVPEAIYPQLKTRLESELAEAEVLARSLERAESRSYDDGLKILTLAQTAAARFEKADSPTKRLLLHELQSHCIIRDGKLTVQLQKPFDLLLETNEKSRLMLTGTPDGT